VITGSIEQLVPRLKKGVLLVDENMVALRQRRRYVRASDGRLTIVPFACGQERHKLLSFLIQKHTLTHQAEFCELAN